MATITLLFASERFFVVLLPFKARLFSTNRSAFAMAIIILFAMLINITSFRIYFPADGDPVDSDFTPNNASFVLLMFTFNYTVPNVSLLAVVIQLA